MQRGQNPEKTEKCVQEFRALFKKYGIQVINAKWLKENTKGLHNRIELLEKNPLAFIAEKLGVLKEYEEQRVKAYCVSSGRIQWTDEMIDTTIKEIIERYKCFPCQIKLNQDGYKGFVSAIGRRRLTIESISKKYNDPDELQGMVCYGIVAPRHVLQISYGEEVSILNAAVRTISHTRK